MTKVINFDFSEFRETLLNAMAQDTEKAHNLSGVARHTFYALKGLGSGKYHVDGDDDPVIHDISRKDIAGFDVDGKRGKRPPNRDVATATKELESLKLITAIPKPGKPPSYRLNITNGWTCGESFNEALTMFDEARAGLIDRTTGGWLNGVPTVKMRPLSKGHVAWRERVFDNLPEVK